MPQTWLSPAASDTNEIGATSANQLQATMDTLNNTRRLTTNDKQQTINDKQAVDKPRLDRAKTHGAVICEAARKIVAANNAVKPTALGRKNAAIHKYTEV